jgi:DNA polymerase III alpha subunit
MYGRPILNDIYFAMKFGLVPSNIKDLIEASEFLSEEELFYRNTYLELIDQKQRYYKSIEKADAQVFSQSDRDCIKTITEHFVKKNHSNYQKFLINTQNGQSLKTP